MFSLAAKKPFVAEHSLSQVVRTAAVSEPAERIAEFSPVEQRSFAVAHSLS